MKFFFIKKYCFAMVFILGLMVFSIFNCFHAKDELKELGQETLDIKNIDDLESWIENVENTTGEAILGRMPMIEAYGGIQLILGKREFNNFAYIKDVDGMFYYGAFTEIPMDELKECASNVKRLNEYVTQKGKKLIVIIPPTKILNGICKINHNWPINDPNSRIDKFMNLMMKNGVLAIDLRSAMMKSGANLEELFFRTDHHWTPLAAFYATRELVSVVEEKYGDDWDPTGYYTDINNYESQMYYDVMLGSMGRDTGITYSGKEDYLLLWPKCDNQYTWINYEKEEQQSGGFREALFVERALKIEDFYNENFNQVYLREINTSDRIINHSNLDGPKLTVLRDLYFSPMACFLAPMCREIDMVWNKKSNNDINFDEFIRESDGDYVILEVYPYNLNADSFCFFQEEGQINE